MASSIQKLEVLQGNNFNVDHSDVGVSVLPVFDSFSKFTQNHIYYGYMDAAFRKSLRRQRLLTPREDPFHSLTAEEIKLKYKFYPHTIYDLCELLGESLRRDTSRNNALSVLQVVCVGLYQLGHGKYVIEQL